MNIAATIAPTIATIDQLKPGSEHPTGTVNSRKDYAPADVKTRLESILAFGILRPLLVMPGKATATPPFYVADGGLSREAIALGVKDKKLPKDYPIKISVLMGDAVTALAASLEANEQVLPPHPVKVFETFAELVTRGKTEDEIGKLFRMGLKEVKGVLALGALSPKIRKAWIAEEIDADDAKAFTLAADHKQQDAVFDKCKKTRDLYAHAIRQAIIGDTRDTQRFLTYVGRAAYEAAGGKLQEDLFSEGKHLIVLDPALLTKLSSEKFDADMKALKDTGWAEVEHANELPHDHTWNWKKVSGGAKASAAVKAKGTCAVSLDREGKLEVLYLTRPAAPKAKAGSKKAVKSKAKPSNVLSDSLKERLRNQLNQATQDALKIVAKTGKGLEGVLAGVVGEQINFRNNNYTPAAVRDHFQQIRDALPAKALNEAIAKRFDAADYFPKAPHGVVLTAITEALGSSVAAGLKTRKKSDTAKFALANIPERGWLPKEMRTAHYTGPGAAQKKAR